jgi:hypothetical protein
VKPTILIGQVLVFIFATVAISPLLLAADGVYIAEFMADNRGTVVDEDERAADWIELHNDSEVAVELLGYRLTDDPSTPAKWVFPARVLQPDGRLLVFASGKDRRVASGTLHTNFSLDADGEYLALASPSGELLSVWDKYPAQEEDESYGLASGQRSIAVIDTRASCRWSVPFGSSPDLSWAAPDFDDSRWVGGFSGLGYDFGTDYQEFLTTDTQREMNGFSSSLRARFPFDVQDPESLVGVSLRIRFDDGFVAFLNGERIAEEGAPDALLANSRARRDRAPADAIEELVVDLLDHVDLITKGENMLAIQGLNVSSASGDFLLSPRLVLESEVSEPEYGVMIEPTPGTENQESFAGRVAKVTFDQVDRFHIDPMSLTMVSATPGAEIRYTFSGAPPSPSIGTLYNGPVQVGETFAVRARAYKDGLLPSSITTRTYIFPQEMASQSVMNQSIVNADRSDVERQFQEGLPILSLAVDPTDLFGPGGIDTVPDQDREVVVSMEYFSGADPANTFQVDAGMAIHGGNARSHPKKPFRFFFRRKYGAARLEFPLFDGSPVSSFDQLVLRAGGHDSWSISETFGATDQDLPFHATYLRDQFLRKTEIDMGRLSPRGRYVQLVLNGFFWGVYDLHERPNSSFFSDHLGGMKKDWDVLHHADDELLDWAVISGEDTHWKSLHERLEKGVDSSQTLENLQTEIDLDELIDSLIVRMWSGDFDWAGPILWRNDEVTSFRNKNWYTGQYRGDRPGFFRYFAWDAEMSMGSHLLFNVFGVDVNQRVVDLDLTEANDPGTPAAIHQALRFLPLYRQRFGDRVQKHFFENGVLNVGVARARLDEMIAQLDPLMIAESARWGDLHRFNAIFTRDENWRPEVSWLRETFLPERNEIFLNQVTDKRLMPEIAAPTIRPFGGSLDGLGEVSLTSEEGTIYFTTDGTDPVELPRFERRVLVDETSVGHFLIPSIENGGAALGDSWKEREAPASFNVWTKAVASLGYDAGFNQDYAPHFSTDVGAMDGVNTSIYLRVLFELADPEAVETLLLRAKFDDGFAAFVNGEPLVGSGVPADLAWDSESDLVHVDGDAVFFRDFDVTVAKEALVEGSNLLAVQVLNGDLRSSDLLFSPELIVITTDGSVEPSPTSHVVREGLTLTERTTLKARVRSSQGEWSALSEAHFFLGEAPLEGSLRISEIHYHPLSSDARPSGDFEFIELVNTSAQSIQLGGLRFSEGIEFAFEDRLLEAGARLLIVSDKDAFTERYGQALAEGIVGVFGGTSRLSNGGEVLSLVNDIGQIIDQVSYSDSAPWPSAADGGGVSLARVRFDQGSGSDDWRVSVEVGGSPGSEGQPFNYTAWRANLQGADGEPLADPDGDGKVNLLEYFSGTDPLAVNETVAINLRQDGGSVLLDVEQMAAVADVAVTVEGSADLLQWEAYAVEADETMLEDGLTVVSYRLPRGRALWYRLKLELR